MNQARLQDVTYVHRYYDYLSPMRIVTAMLQAGRMPPRIHSSFNYLDIGCGFADSLLIHAAMYPHAHFYGVDFNPSHVAVAQRIAQEANIDNVSIIEGSFEDINSNRLTIPQCDFVVCNSVLSQSSNAQTSEILKVLDQKLKSGGVSLVSYNAAPKQTHLVGVVHFLHQAYHAGSGTNAQRVANALKAWGTAINNNVGALGGEAMKSLHQQMSSADPRVIAHDYMVGDWSPYYASQLHDMVYRESRLEYVGQADPDSYFVDGALPQEVREVLETAPNPSLRTQIVDYLFLKDSRRDIFARGSVAMTETLFNEVADQVEVLPLRVAASFTHEAQMSGFSVKFDEQRVRDLAAILGKGSTTISNLSAQTAKPGQRSSPLSLFKDIIIMNVMGNTTLRLLQSNRDEIVERCHRLNVLFKKNYGSENNLFLALPQSERACSLSQLDMMFLDVRSESKPMDVLFDAMNKRGMRLQNDKKEHITTVEGLEQTLGSVLQNFIKQRLPSLEREGLRIE